MAYITTAELRSYLDMQDTTTFTADPATEYLLLASVPFVNTLSVGTEVTLTNSEAVPDLPAPLAIDTVYYVILVADQNIQLATTSALAAVPTPINITDAGTGTHTIWRAVEDTDLLEDAIAAAEKFINDHTNSAYEADTETRYYLRDALNPADRMMLLVDKDLLTITTLTNGDSGATVIPATEYWLHPRNQTAKFGIRLETNSVYSWDFDPDYFVSVAGTWGRSTTADAKVKQATTHLAAFFYRQKDSQVFDVTAIPEQGVIQIPQGLPASVVRLIKDNKRSIGW